MKIKSKSFNIVIYPPTDIAAKAIKISKTFKKKGSSFVLDGKNYFPHITIYMTEFPLKNIPVIKKLLKEFVLGLKSFQITASGYRQNKDGYIDVSYKKTKSIKELQKKLITLLNPLREGRLRSKDKEKMKEYRRSHQKKIKLYGYRSVGAEFYPHLTFTKLEQFNESALPKIKEGSFSFKVNKIGLFYLGEYGTCRKLIKIFDLS
jgi:2'-5' RNA ligase